MRLKGLLFILASSLLSLSASAQSAPTTITTFAGGGPNNVPAATANLNFNYGVAPDSSGNVFIPDVARCAVFKVNSSGTLTVFAGQLDVCGYGGDNGPATSAVLNGPSNAVVDGSGNVYIADTTNNRIRRVDHVTGFITTYAGNGVQAFGGDNGPATSASLNLNPGNIYYNGLAVDSSGNLFIADTFNARVRRVDTSSPPIITTYAGNGTQGFLGDGSAATQAELADPNGLAFDATTGDLYIADLGNKRVRMVNTASPPAISTVAGGAAAICGTATDAFGDGCPATSAQLTNFSGVGVDSTGNIYIADRYNNLIREVDHTSTVISVVGGTGTACTTTIATTSPCGDGGPATSAQVNLPVGLNVDAAGDILISDSSDNRVREIYCANANIPCTPPAGFAAGDINTFTGNGLPLYSGNGVPAGDACLFNPTRVTADAAGDLFIVDTENFVIRRIDGKTGIITTIAGTPGVASTVTSYGDNGPATSARFVFPLDVAVDAAGNIYVADPNDSVIRRVDASTGIITTVAGNGGFGYNGDGIPATQAELATPIGVSFNAAGDLFIADASNNRIRHVDHVTQLISTIAGNGNGTFGGDGGPATSASLNFPEQAVFDGAGNLFIADNNNSRIRRVDAITGFISTVAGNGTAGSTGSGVLATSAELNTPMGVALDVFGSFFVTDYTNESVRRVDVTSQFINLVAGNGTSGFAGDGGTGISAELSSPQGAAVDPAANLYIADTGNNRIRAILNPGAALYPSPIPILFGNQPQGTATGPAIVTLSNTGVAQLNVTAATVTGANAADFTPVAGGTCAAPPFSVDPGTSCTVEFTFTPSTTAAESATLMVTDNAPYSPQPIGLTGTGTNGIVVSGVSFNPSTVVSGEMTTGTVTIDGVAPAGGLTVSLTSSNPAAFPVPGAGNVIVPAGMNSQTFTVTAGTVAGVTPVTITATSGTTVVTGNATVVATMAGMAVIISPTGLTFGPLPVGTAAGAQAVSVANDGTVALSLTSIVATGSGFGLGPATTCPTGTGVLAAGASCVLSVTFKPEFAGTVSGLITLTDGAASSPQTIALTGTGGMPSALLSTTTLTFGGQQLSTTSASQSATLTNTGGAPLTISSVTPGGANPGDFGESDNCTSAGTLGPGASCTITITFTPTAVARRSAQVTITDNDSTGTQTVFFSGLGNTPATGYGRDIITTIAGGGQPSGSAVAADLPAVGGVAVDSSGNLIVTLGAGSAEVVKVNTAGNVSVIAGTGVDGFSGDGGPATSATLNIEVGGVATDGAGNVFVVDVGNCVVRRVDAASGTITTAAGNYSLNLSTGCVYSGDGGPATNAGMNPVAVALDHGGNLYISDYFNCVVRRVDATTGIITTVAGTVAGAGTFSNCGYGGDGGAATSARLNYPEGGIALDGSGNLYITDTLNCVIRRVDATMGIITTVAGNFSLGCGYNGDGILATSATLNAPSSVAVDSAGNLYIADGVNFVVRRVDATTHIITTVAGTPGVAGYSGDGGAATSAKLNCTPYPGPGSDTLCDEFVGLPFGIALDGAGNLFIADTSNNRVRRVDASTGKITTVAGGGLSDGGPATSAVLDEPTGLAASPAGDIFIGDGDNFRVRKVLAATGAISTVVGTGVEGSSGDGGPATSATLLAAAGIARDSSGNLFFSDTLNSRVRRVDATTGVITTVAGGGTGGDGGPATSASLATPTGLVLDGAGDLLIADSGDNRIRRVDAVTGIITTVAGTGAVGYNGDGIPATSAELSNPRAVAFDDSGNLYIADTNNRRIREVSGGIITTYAGNGTAGFSGDGGAATAAELGSPKGIAFGTFGNLFISDQGNNRIRRVYAATGIITTVAGNGLAAFGGDGGDAVLASFDGPAYLAVDSSDNLYVSDEVNNRIRKVQFQPSAVASPASLTFPSTAVGATSAPMDITLTTPGGALTVTSIVAAGNFAETDNCVGVVPPGLSCTISVTFTPSATGPLNGSITINDNAGTGSQLVTLTGTGTTTAVPVVSLMPASVSFGNVVETTTSGAIAVTLTNVGTPNLVFSSNPAITGANMADFAIASSTCSTASPVPTNGSCTVMVTFTPSTLTVESASLNFADNATPPNQSVPLSGTGVSATTPPPTFNSFTLPSGALGVLYGADIQVTGGTQPYTFAVTSGALPAGFSMTATGSGNVSGGHIYSSGTPPATGTFTFGVTVSDAASNMTTATISFTIGTAPPNTQASLLKGQYAFLGQAFSDSGGDEQGLVGSLTFDGVGTVTGVVDSNGTDGIKSLAVTGTYSVGPDNRGFLQLTAAGQQGGLNTAMAVGNVYRGVASTVRLTNFNDNHGNDRIGSGFLRLQDPTAFNQNSLAGTYVFGGTGQTPSPSFGRVAEAGLASFDNMLNVTAGTIDINEAGTTGSATFTGAYTAPDPNGRSVLSETITPGGPSTSVVYIISANEVVFMDLDPRANNDLVLGSALRQPNPNTFTNSSITGPDVVRLMGSSGSGTSNAIIGLATAVTSPSATLTINYDNNDSGTISTNQTISGPYSVAMNGRASGALTGTSGSTTLIFYLATPDRGFVISSGNSVVAGQLVPQVVPAGGFVPSSFNNNFFFGVQETVTGKEAISGIAVLSPPSALNLTADDSHSGGNLTFGENLSVTYTVASNGHFTIPQIAGVGGETGYAVSPYETDFLDAGTGPNSSMHPDANLAQSIPAPPGTPSPTPTSVNFAAPVMQGSMAQSAPITFTNTGLGPLGFTGADTTNSPDFSASGTCIPVSPVVVVVIQPGASCMVTVTFAPTAMTPTGTMLNEPLVLDTDGTTNVTINASGMATPATGSCGTNTWTGASGGQWGTATNWSSGAVPISTDTACIPTGFTVNVGALAAANQSISSLAVQGTSTLSFNGGPLTVTTTATVPTLNVGNTTLTITGAATIGTSATIGLNATVNFNGATSIAALNLAGGTIAGTGSITVSGAFTWSAGGALNSSGTTSAASGITMSCAVSCNLSQSTGTLNSNGPTSISNGTNFTLQNGAIYNQAVGTTFTATGNTSLYYSAGTNVAFNVLGSFVSNPGAGNTVSAEINFVNSGTLTVTSGTFSVVNNVFGGGTLNGAGAFNVPAAGTLLFNSGGTSSLSGAVSGAGAVTFQSGTQTLTGTYAITGLTTISGATVNFNTSSPANLGSLALSFGTLAGTSNVTVAGAFNWTQGGMNNSATTTASSGLTMSCAASCNLSLSAGILTSNGPASISSGTNLTLQNGAIYNQSAGTTFTAGGNTSLYYSAGAAVTFNNAGTFISNPGAGGTVSIELSFVNTGTVNVQSGTMVDVTNIFGSGSFSGAGTYTVASGATFQFNSSATFTISGPVNGAGTVQFSTATVNLSGPYNITGATMVTGGTANLTGPAAALGAVTVSSGTLNLSGSSGSFGATSLTQSGGTISGSSSLGVAGAFNWTAGLLGITGTTTANGGINITGAGTATLSAGTLISSGHTIQSGTTTLQIENGGVFMQTAAAVYDAQSVFGIRTSTSGTFNNAGAFNRSGSAGGALPVSVVFNNTGTVNVQISELDFNGGGSCPTGGSMILASGVILGFNKGTFNMACPLSGAGEVNTLGGTFNFATGASATGVSSLFVGTTTTIASGVNLGIASVTVQTGGTLEGTGTISGNLTNSGGTVHPGMSPGILSINGNFTQSSGTLAIDLGGTTAGTGYSQLVVNGTATLAGTLTATDFGGFTPTAGNSFIIVLPTAVSGTFTTTNLPSPPVLSISYAASPTGVVLQAAGGCDTWTGTAGDGQWGTAGNWTSGIPIATSAVCLPAGTTQTVGALAVANQTIQSVTAAGANAITFNSGPLTVTGAASLSSLNATAGTITFTSGATFAASLTVSGGTVVLNGATTIPTLTIGSGTLSGSGTVTDTSTFAWSGGTLSGTGKLNLGGTSTISSTVASQGWNINNNGGALTMTGATTVLNLSGGAQITNASSWDMGNAQDIAFSGTPVSTFNNMGTLKKSMAGNSFFNVPLNNTGAVNVLLGNLDMEYGGTGNGSFSMAAGALLDIDSITTPPATYSWSGSFTGPGALAVDSNATVTFANGSSATGISSLDAHGNVIVGSIVNLGIASFTVESGETLSGFGTITGNVTNNGILHPGGSPGVFTINGNYTQSATGALNSDLAGTGAGLFSELVVSGAATLAGSLNVVVDSPFVPAAGNAFELLNPGSVSGTFSTTSLPPAPAGSNWTLAYNPSASGGVVLAATSMAPVVGPLTPVAFGSVPQFTTSGAMTVTLTNTGNAVLNFTAAPGLSGTNVADFAITANTCVVGTPVAANGGTCMVTLTFTPSTGGSETASLAFMDNATPATQNVALTGTGIPPTVTVTGTTAFGNQMVMTTSAPQTLTVSVTAGTGTLELTSITLSGTNAGDFAIAAAGSTCPLGAGTLVGGASCTVAITFTPAATGARTAMLNVAGSDLPGSPKMVALSGTGTAPAVTLAPTALTFGVVPLGMSSTLSVMVTNSGTAPLTFNNITITGPNMADFLLAEGTTCSGDGGQVTAGNSCTIAVTFTPSAIQPESATLNLFDNAAGSPQTVPLAGGGPGFTLTVPPPASGGTGLIITVLPGDTAVYTLMITCSPGVTGTVTLTGSGALPPSTILTITPSMITCPSATPVTVQVKLQTNCVPSLVAPLRPVGPGSEPGSGPGTGLPGSFAALWVAAILLAAGMRRSGSFGKRQGWARQLAPVCAALMLVMLVMTWTACVSNLPPAIPNAPTTPAGNYPLTIVATGPTGAHVTIVFTVKVI